MDIITRVEAQAQGLTHYFTGIPCRNGHVSVRGVKKWNCLECDRNQKAAERVRDPERVRLNEKKTADKHRDKKRAFTKEWRAANKEYTIQKDRERYARLKSDPEKLARRNAVTRAYWKRQREQCTPRAVEMKLRARMYQALLRAGTNKKASTAMLIGCTPQELRDYLELQFLPGMTWDNWTTDGWHVDHIRPCASFDLTDPEQQRECFHFSNLQPLWAEDNFRKSDKLEPARMAA